jgi:hypothetical protein
MNIFLAFKGEDLAWKGSRQQGARDFRLTQTAWAAALGWFWILGFQIWLLLALIRQSLTVTPGVVAAVTVVNLGLAIFTIVRNHQVKAKFDKGVGMLNMTSGSGDPGQPGGWRPQAQPQPWQAPQQQWPPQQQQPGPQWPQPPQPQQPPWPPQQQQPQWPPVQQPPPPPQQPPQGPPRDDVW